MHDAADDADDASVQLQGGGGCLVVQDLAPYLSNQARVCMRAFYAAPRPLRPHRTSARPARMCVRTQLKEHVRELHGALRPALSRFDCVVLFADLSGYSRLSRRATRSRRPPATGPAH